MTDRSTSLLSFERWNSLPEPVVRRAFWTFALVLLAFRLLILAVLPLDLSGDEAYYWEWGRHLDWGYFSKPPGIAWLMALAGKVGGDTTFGVRMFAAFLGTGSMACVFFLALKMYGRGVAMITALAFVANPANAALNLTLTIDAPLMLCWTLGLLALWHFINAAAADRLRWGALLMLALVGGILSKQMMLAFAPLAIVFLVLSREYRAQLRTPGLWLCLVGSLAALLPPLWWNVQNDWLTVKHTMHHFESGGVGWLKQIGRMLEFIGSQLGIITPVFYVLVIALCIAVPFAWRRLGDRERYLWIFGGPVLLVMFLMGLRQRINPNWPAVFYASTLLLMIAWAAGQFSLDLKADRWRRAFPVGLKIAIVFAVLVYAAAVTLSLGLIRLEGLDPTARLRGWSTMARGVDAARRELPAGMPVIAQGHRYLASELSFYLHDQPRVYLYNPEPGTIRSQHDLWETPAAHLGRDCLIVLQGTGANLEPALTNRFDSVTVHQILRYPQEREGRQTVTLAVGRNLREWPGLTR